MRKVIISTLIVVVGLSLLGYATNNTEQKHTGVANIMADIVEYPFPAFTIQYPVNPDNPDPLRDNNPFVEYDPEEGWTFYRVEMKPDKTNDDHNRYRIAIDDTLSPIQLHFNKDDDYHQQLKMIFDDKISFQANADFYSERFSINHFCLPHKKSNCYPNNLIFQKCIRFTREPGEKYYTGGAFTCSCRDVNEFIFSPSIGSIQIYDDNLQFEQWDISREYSLERHTLSARLALNPHIHDMNKILGIDDYLLGFQENTYLTTMNKNIIELHVDKDTFRYNGVLYEFIFRKDRCPDVTNYNCCREYKGVIIMPLISISELLDLKTSCFDPKTNNSSTDVRSVEIPYQKDGENQIITFREGSNTMEFRYGNDKILTIGAFTIPDDPNIYINDNVYCGYFDMHIPLFPFLDEIPRYYDKGYKYRPMNKSILISTSIRNR